MNIIHEYDKSYFAHYCMLPHISLETFRIIFKYEVNLGVRDKQDNTPLHLLLNNKSWTPQILTIFIVHGANVNSVSISVKIFLKNYFFGEFLFREIV